MARQAARNFSPPCSVSDSASRIRRIRRRSSPMRSMTILLPQDCGAISRLRPGESLDPTIDAFLRAHAGQPVAHGLRREWLVNLAQRQRWDWFLPRSLDVVDPALLCDRLAGRLATGDTAGLADAALAQWMLPQKPLPECSAVFAWLRQQGLLTSSLAESRSRAALAAGNPRLAREFAADVAVPRRAALLQWSDLLESPLPALNILARHQTMPVEAEALASGFEKLTRSDPAAALDLLPWLLGRDQMTAELQARLQRTAALGAAYDHDPQAMMLLDQLPAAAIDAQVQEWRVRAAVWSGDYAKALVWIEQMPTSLFEQPRWRYWRARAVLATTGEAAAAPLLREIAGLRDYYGYLAADRLHQGYNLNCAGVAERRCRAVGAGRGPKADSRTRIVRLRHGGRGQRGMERGCGRRRRPALKVQAALLAARWGWFAQAIATLAQTGEFDDVKLRYPRPFLDTVDEASSLAQRAA